MIAAADIVFPVCIPTIFAGSQLEDLGICYFASFSSFPRFLEEKIKLLHVWSTEHQFP